MPAHPSLTTLIRPGRRLQPAALTKLVAELREVASTCFPVLPTYQVLTGDKALLDRAVITLAYAPDGRLVGFCAMLLLPVEGVGDVLHLGLTCVRPEARRGGLTHALLSHGLSRYVLRHALWRGVWFTSVASVLSSLGNIATHFEDVHPSPFRAEPPSPQHLQIASQVATRHRERMHLRPDARFCPDRFVFAGANLGTVFHKSARDVRYRHRDEHLTSWFSHLADLDRGDAVLQVGRVSVPGFLRYALRRVGSKLPGLRRFVGARPMLPASLVAGR